MIEWVADQDSVIMNDAFDRQFGPIGEEPVEDIQEKSEQVHVALLVLTGSESFDKVLGAAPSGLEAPRRLVRRWGPLSGGKRRALLRQILVPDRCKLQGLLSGLEKWEERVRRYERSKSSGTTTTALDDNIKTAALAEANSHSRQLHRRSPQIRRRWTALAREARKARKARKEKVMVRTSRKKVNIRTKVRIQTRTLFVGTAVRKAI